MIAHVLGDILFIQTGIESDELDAATDRLKLEEDPEYQMLVKEYTEQVQSIRLGQP